MTNCKQIKASEILMAFPQEFDVFIVSASYEKRCFTVSEAFRQSPTKRILVAGNINHLDYIGTSWDKLCSIFGSKAIKVQLNSDNPIFSADQLIYAINNLSLNQPANLLLDISTFTREALFILIGVLYKILKPQTKITCVYNSARKYGWLSRGISDIRSVLGFPGNIIPSRKNHLIVLPGYETERAINLIAAYEPNLLSIGFNNKDEAVNPQFVEEQQMFLKQLCSMYPSSMVKMFEVSARDPFKTKAAILEHVKAFKQFNTILAPLNTKVSSVGGCLAAIENKSIQLCYAQPEGYNIHNYSEPSEDVFIFEVVI